MAQRFLFRADVRWPGLGQPYAAGASHGQPAAHCTRLPGLTWNRGREVSRASSFALVLVQCLCSSPSAAAPVTLGGID